MVNSLPGCPAAWWIWTTNRMTKKMYIHINSYIRQGNLLSLGLQVLIPCDWQLTDCRYLLGYGSLPRKREGLPRFEQAPCQVEFIVFHCIGKVVSKSHMDTKGHRRRLTGPLFCLLNNFQGSWDTSGSIKYCTVYLPRWATYTCR